MRILILILIVFAMPLKAIDTYTFENPENEERFKALSSELRCLVCQNQTISGSNADLAKDLRKQIYEMIHKGQSNQEIIDFMVERYGDFVLYKPPLKATTIVLWIGPFILLIIAIVVLIRIGRHHSKPSKLDEQQREQMRKLLEGQGEEK